MTQFVRNFNTHTTTPRTSTTTASSTITSSSTGTTIDTLPGVFCNENDLQAIKQAYSSCIGELKASVAWYLENRSASRGCVTIDADNQHHPEDIEACVIKMLSLLDAQQQPDSIVLGVRDFDAENVPPKSRFGNKCTSFIFRAFCGLKISDTQTGLRAFPQSVIPLMLEIDGERFEYETNMLLKFKQTGIKMHEVTIQTLYEEEGKHESHFKTISDSIRVYSFILGFLVSSVASSVIDLLIFYIFLILNQKVFHFLLDDYKSDLFLFHLLIYYLVYLHHVIKLPILNLGHYQYILMLRLCVNQHLNCAKLYFVILSAAKDLTGMEAESISGFAIPFGCVR